MPVYRIGTSRAKAKSLVRGVLLVFVVIGSLSISSTILRPVHAVSWGQPSALPGTDPYSNNFAKALLTSNGTLWLVWGKLVTTYGEIYLMTYNTYGWSGQTKLLDSNGIYDDITPSIAQLTNGTIVMVWARGATGTGGCYSNGLLYSLYTRSYTPGRGWNTPSQLVQTPDDNSPTLTTLRDGRLFLTWSRCTHTNGSGDLYYKTYNGTWGSEAAIPNAATAANEEKLPTITQTTDGKVWVFYSTNVNNQINQIYYVTWNLSTWTTPIQFTSTGNDDDWATVAQDRNGTIWTMWSRLLSNGTQSGTPTSQYDLFYRNSTNLGATWSTEQTLAPNIHSQDIQGSLVQYSDKKLWLVYTSDQQTNNPYRSPNLYLLTSGIVKVHDPTITGLNVPITHVRSGRPVNITVQVTNEGDYSETPQVNYYANRTLVKTGSVTVPAGQTVPLTLSWGTVGKSPGAYILNSTLLPVPGQISNVNTSMAAPYILFPAGDVNLNGEVDIIDAALVATKFGAAIGTPKYLAAADLNNDGVIDIVDLATVGSTFGQSLNIPDFAVSSMTLPNRNPRVGEPVSIPVAISNIGFIQGSSQVSLYIGQYLVGTQPITLNQGQNTTLTFNWNTTGKPFARYTVSANIATANGEFNTSNNVLNSTLILVPRGDVNRDGTVDIVDMALIAGHFGATQGSANYYPDADLNKNGLIDVVDLTLCSLDFGKSVF